MSRSHSHSALLGYEKNGRGARIRTGGLLRPRQARYQAALRPDMLLF
jgi:hypothetical protein